MRRRGLVPAEYTNTEVADIHELKVRAENRCATSLVPFLLPDNRSYQATLLRFGLLVVLVEQSREAVDRVRLFGVDGAPVLGFGLIELTPAYGEQGPEERLSRCTTVAADGGRLP